MNQTSSTQESEPTSEPQAVSRPPLGNLIRRYPATFGLIGVTVLIYLGQILSEQVFGVDILLVMGAKINEAIRAGEVWRLITPIFLHVGIWHIFVNMYALFAIGPPVERFFGSRRMLTFYILSGMTGVVFSLAFSPNPSVGASGSIFGILGCFGMFLYTHRKIFGRPGSYQLRQIIIIALFNLVLGFLVLQIDNWGHLGGLVGGVLLTLFLGPLYEMVWMTEDQYRLVDSRPWSRIWPYTLVALLLIILAAYAATISPFTQ
ncbi:MAG: rhomboid family intramembrane serine protease [Anaerolineales bacterium]|nr:rhomboid family intramembrane serine protease [Anaerolineales bacterium]